MNLPQLAPLLVSTRIGCAKVIWLIFAPPPQCLDALGYFGAKRGSVFSTPYPNMAKDLVLQITDASSCHGTNKPAEHKHMQEKKIKLATSGN